jgi:hypothetical protein
MQSRIARAIESPHPPVAVILTDDKPEGAAQFKEGKWGCVIWLLAGAFRGKAAVVDESTYGCYGGGTGLGFGDQYQAWPGGIECFYGFLSTGNEEADGTSAAEAARSGLRRESFQRFLHGERYLKSPEVARRFVDALPMTRIPARYVLFKPLAEVDPAHETVSSVVFLVDADRLSALTVLANHAGPGGENVIIPWAAGCQSIGIYALREAASERPRAVVGLVDISARRAMNRQFGSDLLTFSIPFRMFLEMEGNVEGSFLEHEQWQELLGLRRQRDG